MRRMLAATFLGAALLAPIATQMRADDRDHRYYDSYHRDYHAWNDGEARAYRHWLVEERHRPYHEWERSNRREQRDYWRWRHEHMDWR